MTTDQLESLKTDLREIAEVDGTDFPMGGADKRTKRIAQAVLLIIDHLEKEGLTPGFTRNLGVTNNG